MKKLIALSVLILGVLVISGKEASAANTRGAKGSFNLNYTTTVSSVAIAGPAVVYQVILGTGTAGTDHVSLWDLSAVGATIVGGGTGLKAKINVSSATQNTVVTFDPPLQFNNGIVAANSAATTWSAIIYERGRVTQGY